MYESTGTLVSGEPAGASGRPASPIPAPVPGSLAADLASGAHTTALLFPGIDGSWPRALADALVGRPDLSAWVDAVVAELDHWAQTPEVRALGLFSDGFSRLVHTTADAPVSPVASTGPFNLVGNLLTNLVSLAALDREGLHQASTLPSTQAAGHSAGLLAAWVAAAARGQDGLVPVGVAADAARVAAIMGVHAARHPWAVSDSVISAALASDEDAHTPMVAIAGPRTPKLRAILEAAADSTGGEVAIAVTNSPTRHVLSGNPQALALLHQGLSALAQSEANRRAKGRLGGTPFRFAWEPLPSSVPFHHPDLGAAAAAALEQIEELGLSLPAEAGMTIIDPASGEPLGGPDVTATIVTSILAKPHDWVGAVTRAVPTGSVAVFVSPLGSLAGVSASILRGRGALVVNPASTAGRTQLFTPGSAPAMPATYDRFAPRVVRTADGSLRLVNRHTRLSGRSPMVLPGMTPSTAEAPIVVAAANGGHVAELAGGGQVNERIFSERVKELTETLDPGQEVVLNAMYLDPYLWGLHVGKERLVLKARASGAPFCGVTISAGIPDKPEALSILDELVDTGLWLNAFKPGTVAQVKEVLSIAADTPHPLWIHLEGGAAGGHHSWEDLDELLLATYHLVREHDNVVLAVGGGVGDPQRAAALLTGTWAHAYGAPTMPVDAILLGTVTMATHEAAASASVKRALAEAQGHSGWVGRGQVAGGTTSGRSSLDADIYFLDNSASRCARLLDTVAGNADAVAAKRDEIIEALSRTAKPYFGDVAEMTYAEMLERFVALTAMGRHGRYEDGAWLDPTHRSRFIELLRQAEARLDPADSGTIETRFATPDSVDDPAAAVATLVEAHPSARTALLHPADAGHFMSVMRRPGKPVPFVPVIDADVRRWYQSDSLWQSHSDLFEADQVLIIPGPTAVAGITTVDEPVAHLLDRFEFAVAEAIGAPADDPLDVATFRLGLNGVAPAASPEAVLTAALAAPTWLWLGSSRTNPLHRIGATSQWAIAGDSATWSSDGSESATLHVRPDGQLALTISWPSLGLPGDGTLVLPIDVTTRAGVVTFAVTAEGLGQAGGELLRMFANGTGSPTDPQALAAGHAATVGAANALPDRVMATLWPPVFAALADAGLASSIFDLVHLRHELVSAPIAQDLTVAQPALSRTDGGLVITVDSSASGSAVTDRFFVRRSVLDPELPVATAPAALDGVVSTPVRTLGRLTVTAPSRLETFATVSGDANPIHRSDVLARLVGLPGRIVHGMWTSAAATRAVIESATDGSPARLRHWSIDFVAPVLPGQDVTFTVQRTGVRNGARVLSVEAATEAGVVAMGTAVVAPPRTAYVFPGQGIQSQGMGMDGYARSAAARAVWDEADQITRTRMGFSILEVVRNNPTQIEAVGTAYQHPAGVLHLTQFTQVAMATLATAQTAELKERGVFDSECIVAGHSVGEFNALAAASDALTLEGLIHLVFARGQGMHGLVPRDAEGQSNYRLAVIRPHLARLSHAQAEEMVNQVSADTGELCEIVNHNLRGKQYAVAGTLGALEELGRRLGDGQPGRPPILYVPGIDVPFHSSALLVGVDDFRGHLNDKLPAHIEADGLVGRYIPNLYPQAFRLDRSFVEGILTVRDSQVLKDLLADWDAASADRDALARTVLIELLAWQFASPVRWIETFELMTTPLERGGMGVERIVEVGVGTAPTLANLSKGSLALPSHRGTRPRVYNVEVDSDEVFESTEDPAPAPVAEAAPEPAESPAPVPAVPAPTAAPAPVAAPAAVADLPVDHATALAALLALRVGVRVDQLEHDSIESLVDGASSRRNQVLMDIGKEFAVPAIDGAHEVPLVELTSKLAERSPGYRYPGPVLSAAVDGALTGALGPMGSSPAALAKRVSAHWGLGEGWVARTALALALGTREGSSRRGGDLATLDGSTGDALIDAAVTAAAAEAGVAVAPASAASTGGGAVDAKAVTELREHVEGILASQASDVLARLGRLPVADQQDADYREALAKLALLEAEHGSARLVTPTFDARRHVMLASSTTWARADVDHLVQASLAAEAGQRPLDEATVAALVEQIAAHRDADPRIVATLRYHRDRAAAAGRVATAELVERVLATQPGGVSVPDVEKLRAALSDGPAAEVVAAMEAMSATPGAFAGQVALVTGASPNSIAWSSVAHLLRGGATVVVVTTTDTPARIAAYRDLERRYAGPGAQLHVVRANLASFTDIDALIDWMVTPTTESIGPVTREVKPALWPTLVLPFAAAPAGGELPDTREDAQLTLRLLLLGVQRLVGGLAERAAGANRGRFTVILPMSPNHGTFGGDGAYGDAKAALETMNNKWHSEGSRWGSQTRLISAEIGWVRGTGLMSANDRIARHIEDELGVVTYASEQMGALIAALATPTFVDRADVEPVRVDLAGGLGGRADLGAALARAVAELTAQAKAEAAAARADDSTVLIPALPNLPTALAAARAPVAVPAGSGRARVRAEDMVVLVGIAEFGPWGGSWTRREAEVGELSAAGVIELAWRCGLIGWDDAKGGWTDTASGEAVAEAVLAERYREAVSTRVGVRLLEHTDGVAAEGFTEYTEVYLDRPLTKVVATEGEARALAAGAEGSLVTPAEEGWILTLPAGAAVRVPRTRPLRRSVGGQFPSGVAATRHGLESGVAASMDPLAAWNVVISAEALADAGVSAEELVSAVHPSLIGNTQGSGMGGMSSISKLYMGPATGKEHANDVLQEALGNVVSAHVNQSLVGGYGPMVHPVAACATAAVSLEEAIDKIALGKADIIVGGGWDDLSTEGINGFANMAATADNEAMIESGLPPHQHSRPGDRRRKGFVESQGGGTFVVCRGSVALALGLPIRAVLAYAATFGDGIHTSIPAPGLGALGAARGGQDSPLARALADLGLGADDVAVVSKHDTSTEANDPNEAFIHASIQQAIGRTDGAPLRVISQKSLTGHSKGGAAAWQVAGLCDVFQTGQVPGNKNLVSADPRVTQGALVVDYRTLDRHEPVRAAVATSLGFGHVSALVALAHPDVFVEAIPVEQREGYLQRAHERRVQGARSRLAATYGGRPLLTRRTDRRLGEGSYYDVRDREAGMLLDANGTLPDVKEV